MFDRAFPPVLSELHQLEFDYEKGYDFEPYDQFQSADENREWIHAWTGNQELDGAEYRIFGQDGTGGLAMFWLVRKGAPILEQPIVFFGSEGEMGVIARNFGDYLWLLAGGLGPLESLSGDDEREPNAAFTEFAKKHAPDHERKPHEILAAARTE